MGPLRDSASANGAAGLWIPKLSGEKGVEDPLVSDIDGRGETDLRGMELILLLPEVDRGLASDDSKARTGNCKLYVLRGADAGCEAGGAGDIALGLIKGTEVSRARS